MSQRKRLDGYYTSLLRYVLGISWKDHISNETLYDNLPKITAKIKQRRLKLVGHCQRHPEEMAHHVLFWTPSHWRRNRGKPQMTFALQIEKDTELTVEEVKVLVGIECRGVS